MFPAFSGTLAHNHLIVWVAVLCGREEEGKEREDGGGWEELELEAKRRERREGGRREERAGWVGDTEEDRSSAGTNGILGLERVPLTKMLPAQC